MSLDENKNLLFLSASYCGTTDPLWCKYNLFVTMCLDSPVSLEDVETKDLAGEAGQREITVFSLKQVRVFFNGVVTKRNLQSISWLFWGLF